jgi:ABC-type branched-subunit amino acid transport system substrate-binding protein
VVAHVQETQPDVIFFGGTSAIEAGMLKKQLTTNTNVGRVPFFGGDAIADAAFVSAAGNAANDTYYTVPAPQTSSLASAKAFSSKYAKRFHTEPGLYSAQAYAATQILVAAIVKASTADGGAVPTRAEVRTHVAATKRLSTPLGKLGFDIFGDTTSPLAAIYQIKNGNPVFVQTAGG